jgi:predicted restriction endonuclease
MDKRDIGHPQTEETKRKISLAHIGKKRGVFSEEWRSKISDSLKRIGHKPPSPKGRKVSIETRMKKSLALRGSRGPGWRGGVYPENKRIRCSLEYKLWRDAVYKRDNYTCIFCGVRGGKLEADHIKPFAYYPELRFAIDNGRTLCVPCHKTTDTYQNKAKQCGS